MCGHSDFWPPNCNQLILASKRTFEKISSRCCWDRYNLTKQCRRPLLSMAGRHKKKGRSSWRDYADFRRICYLGGLASSSCSFSSSLTCISTKSSYSYTGTRQTATRCVCTRSFNIFSTAGNNSYNDFYFQDYDWQFRSIWTDFKS